jgi:hypothetical protein
MKLPLQMFTGHPKFTYEATILNHDINSVEDILLASTILRVTRKYEPSNENEERKYQCITIRFDHNHPIHEYDVLSHQPVYESTVGKYYRYFEDGLGLAQARTRHVRYLSLHGVANNYYQPVIES